MTRVLPTPEAIYTDGQQLVILRKHGGVAVMAGCTGCGRKFFTPPSCLTMLWCRRVSSREVRFPRLPCAVSASSMSTIFPQCVAATDYRVIISHRRTLRYDPSMSTGSHTRPREVGTLQTLLTGRHATPLKIASTCIFHSSSSHSGT